MLGRDAIAPWITAVALSAAPAVAYGSTFVGDAGGGQRHVMTPVAIVVVLLVAATARAGTRTARIGGVVCLALGAYAVSTSLVLFGHTGGSDMAGPQRCRDSGATLCSTPVAPSGWAVVLTR